MERREMENQELQKELLRLLNVNTDLLTEAISRLDELRSQKQ